MHFNEETIIQLAHLSRIGCTEEERSYILHRLIRIVNFFNQLQEIDTSDVPPFRCFSEEACHPLREDVLGTLLPRDVFLDNAPKQIGGMVKVPPILTS